MIPSRLRAHVYATGILAFTVSAAYGAYRASQVLKQWSNSDPWLQHQEMEDYLRNYIRDDFMITDEYDSFDDEIVEPKPSPKTPRRKSLGLKKRTSDEAALTPAMQKNPVRKVGKIPTPIRRTTSAILSEGFKTAMQIKSDGFDPPDKENLPSTSKIHVEENELTRVTGLPSKVVDTYMRLKKMSKFYDWQMECLSNSRLRSGKNCILSLPTGAGKTLIAEILILYETIVRRRNAILILPYVAIVQEKINALQTFEDLFDINVEEYAANKGRLPPIKRRKRKSIYVATIEKANLLLNSLITTDSIEDIGLVVVDELHMIGESDRGAIIEQLMCKFMSKGKGQIVGMSATLPNMNQLEKALDAFVFSTNFRPVELVEYVKIGNSMWKVMPGGTLKFDADLPENKSSKMDPEGICLLIQTLLPSKSAIIFCPNKKNCENVAVLIAKMLPTSLKERNKAEREKFLSAILEDNDGKMDSMLENCLRTGIAFHHSGLTHDERKHIEAAFMEGLVYVICATSTLAAGVNLPAPLVGRNRIGKAQYLQMAGRAGRAGLDTKGDCITIVKPGEEERWFKQFLRSSIPECSSQMVGDNMTSFLLDLVSLKIASKQEEVVKIMSHSLLGQQKNKVELMELIEEAVKKLHERGLVVIEDDNLASTSLGDAVFTAGFKPSEASRLHGELIESLNNGVIFSSHFHLLYIISPYDCVANIDWDLFHSQYKKLPCAEKKLLSQFGVHEKEILRAIVNRASQPAGSPPMRLYTAMILQHIWNQELLWNVAERFGVERGWVQSLLQSSISQAASISKFSEKIPSMWPLRLLLPELVQRLSEASQPELLPLMAIDGVKRARAALLYSAGFKTVSSIAKSSISELQRAVGMLKKGHASMIISSSRKLLRDQMDEKLEELDALGVGLSDFDCK